QVVGDVRPSAEVIIVIPAPSVVSLIVIVIIPAARHASPLAVGTEEASTSTPATCPLAGDGSPLRGPTPDRTALACHPPLRAGGPADGVPGAGRIRCVMAKADSPVRPGRGRGDPGSLSMR